jgi:beta-xylosidase
LTDIVPGTERTIIPPEAGMGEGVHFYKIAGKYYIFSAWFAGRMRMPCARADAPAGPYEVNLEISADEDFGIGEGARLKLPGPPFVIVPPDSARLGRMSLHQGGIVDTLSGEWWGFSMMDYNSVGRLTCLSPITWQDGWPYFGLPGNLKRTPRIWAKPNTGHLRRTNVATIFPVQPSNRCGSGITYLTTRRRRCIKTRSSKGWPGAQAVQLAQRGFDVTATDISKAALRAG